MDDPYDLARFVAAQDAHGTYHQATAELRAGAKVSHWMWFVFPQITGWGRARCPGGTRSARWPRPAPTWPIRCSDRDWPNAPPSWRPGRPHAEQIFGGIDAQKLRSSMTLFRHADPGEPVFGRVLDLYFAGSPDPATEQRL